MGLRQSKPVIGIEETGGRRRNVQQEVVAASRGLLDEREHARPFRSVAVLPVEPRRPELRAELQRKVGGRNDLPAVLNLVGEDALVDLEVLSGARSDVVVVADESGRLKLVDQVVELLEVPIRQRT